MVSKNIKEVTKLFPEKKKPDTKRQGEAKETKTLISFILPINTAAVLKN